MLAGISYPARSGHMLAVSACGRDGAWPEGTSTGAMAATDPAPVDGVFFAKFSNIGDDMDFIAPGVGLISWVSAADRGVMDGTSMAAPVVTAQIATLLSRDAALLAADRDQQRSDSIAKLAFAQAKPFGFGRDYEGCGLIATQGAEA